LPGALDENGTLLKKSCLSIGPSNLSIGPSNLSIGPSNLSIGPSNLSIGPSKGLLGLTLLGVLLGGCDDSLPQNPFVTTGSAQGGAGFGGSGGALANDPELGGPCIEDAQCDDGIDCTNDACDSDLDRCRFKRDHEACANGVHCDGAEVCNNALGCITGSPFDCSDGDVCSIDTCVEATQSCVHEPRDADGDTDPDVHCGGGDCDDFDPAVSSLIEEVCENDVDDDCDGSLDEGDCSQPENDTCGDALDITATGTHQLTTFGAAFDYATSCSPTGAVRDVVAAVIVPAGPAVDIVARARTTTVPVSVAIAGQCGDAGTEIACGGPFPRPNGQQVARLRARAIGGGAETAFPLYVTTTLGAEVTLDVGYETATSAPTNETCGTAEPLALDVPTEIEIVDAATDLATACDTAMGELVYLISLTTQSDLDLYAVSVDGDGLPSISLRSAACALLEDEIACHTASSAHVFRHSLPAGDYYVSLSASAPTTINLVANASAPTPVPANEDCSSGAVLPANETLDVSFDDHQDDHQLGCFQAAIDVAYELPILAPSDVLLVERLSQTDTGSVALAGPGCAPEDLIVCGLSAKSPLRVRKRNMAAGDYRVVAESLLGLPQQLTAFVRPATPTQLVPFSDACADAVTIPFTGGFFQGNTANLNADFSAGCDASGGPANGANDQMLKLVLPAERRVIFDMSGSGYATMLDVRQGSSCPGIEVPLGCTAAVSGDASYLDLLLSPGTYWVQVDGLDGAVGPWVLDVHVVIP